MKPGDKVIYYRFYYGRPTQKTECTLVRLSAQRAWVRLENGKEVAVSPENLKVIG